ncbi:hypothetical protein CIT292_11002 [Citrobacter youngae ATCC 29220]|uniref:Uncharacterized protein n=1 Tax=Citrobacter youngae ATCC 29220 TaxID=500640 RepID=D4BKC5_9ENTR|nr:hypothetical protein CIT292_11002 [Citrobacter youngae ATCC 29220]
MSGLLLQLVDCGKFSVISIQFIAAAAFPSDYRCIFDSSL